jgi:O-antigen ligase
MSRHRYATAVQVPAMRASEASEPRATLVSGALAVAFLLASSRWGSYVGIGSLYLTDVLVGAAIIAVLTARASASSRDASRRRPHNGEMLLSLCLGYFALRAIFSVGEAPLPLLLRDAAPYLYAVLGLLALYGTQRATIRQRQYTARLLWLALIVHLVWAAPVLLLGLDAPEELSFPGSPTPFFTVRPDVDGALLGVTAAIAVHRVIQGNRRRLNLAISTVAVVSFFGLSTRAGLLSLIVTMCLGLALTLAGLERRDGRREVALLIVLVFSCVVVLVLPSTTVGSRLTVTLGLATAESAAQESALGTEAAREAAWTGVIDWTNSSLGRLGFGVGSGRDFLAESGTLHFLQGTDYTNVRSAHNWLVTTYARYGVVGIVLTTCLIGLAFWRMWAARGVIGSDDLFFLATLIFTGLLVVSLFGVVLESPFGAVPFWWAMGVIFSRSSHLPTSHARSSDERL